MVISYLVDPHPQILSVSVVEIPLHKIKISTRLRATDETKVIDLAESIEGVGLLHPITVSQHGDWFHLLSGMHRLEAFRKLKKSTIPSTINECDPLIEELIEVEENLVSNRLSAIDEARFIVRWEEILTALGRRSQSGDNRWNRSGLTNAELAKNRGMTKRTYQYTKSIANLHPEVQDLLGETEYAFNKMDMVALAKETDEVQLEVAKLLVTGKCSATKRAIQLARCKHLGFDWDEETDLLQKRLGTPTSVMKWEGKDSAALIRLCKLLSRDDDTRVIHRMSGAMEFQLYSQHPDHAAFFIDYYSKKGDLILDCMSGRGTNLLVAAALGRRVVGYDLNPQNLEKVREVALEHTDILSGDLTLHYSDGCELAEYAEQSDLFDLVTFDPPYLLGSEKYNDDPRDLCNVKDDITAFNQRLEICLQNLRRLIKSSSWEKREFHPIVIKVGANRRSTMGLVDMATECEIIARRIGLTLHDKVINVLNSSYAMFGARRAIEHRYTVKVHETNLVFLKYV